MPKQYFGGEQADLMGRYARRRSGAQEAKDLAEANMLHNQSKLLYNALSGAVRTVG
ncbi:hypothetical protein [Nitrosovibrio sp. Nv6]|uniref:hypothetical protein n=1 Tax=Nitrosovibrio sp. Nv6 TaxID=1855340 RepID=UPI001314528E|nr:hypothetical protein [Nitrosovibrio sp. Nv6]